MNAPDHKVRVFISSTFRDMHAERDHLVTVVFPELRERCERLGLEFFDVDLRWGVPEKGVDGESANSWEYCRKWIDEAKPFFICLLGQRYGWEPEPYQLKDDADQQAQTAKRRSITDMEVHHALENDAHSRRCFFYLRQAQAPANATEFVDPPPLLAKLDALKARVETCGRPVWHYPCRWTGSGFTDMEAFGKKVLEDLWSGILRDPRYVREEAWQQVLGTDPAQDSRYADESQPVPDDLAKKLIPLAKPPPKNPLEAERDEMQRFADSRLRWFQGRDEELKKLKKFIADPAEENQPRLAVVAAQPGQGKSALVAKLWEELQGRALGPPRADSDARRVEDNAPYLICHFVGATAQSSSSYHLVKRLNDELDASGIAFPERPVPGGQAKEEPKLDFQSLCQRLWDRLGDYAGEKRIVILLDALNQLDDGHDLGWLPYRLGPSMRVVVSCIEEAGKKMEGKNDSGNLSATHFSASNAEASPAKKVLTALDSRHPKPKHIPLGPLTGDDVRTIVTSYLKEYCKELDAPHVDAICDEKKLPQARNPLYLLVMLAELRTLGGNDMNQHVPALIADMGTQHPDTVSLFDWVLQRLEQAEGFGQEAVRAWCLYLALGRVGMSSRELSDLLVLKLGPDSAATAQRIERALRRYLQRRGEQWDFFHGQLRQAVMERCTHSGTWPAQSPERNQEVSETTRQAHHDIADYFRVLADPAGDKTWKGENQRSFVEIVFHLIGGAAWTDIVGDDANRGVLTDLLFIEAKCTAGHRAIVAHFDSQNRIAMPKEIPGLVVELAQDYNNALSAHPELRKQERDAEKRRAKCCMYARDLASYASQKYSLATKTNLLSKFWRIAKACYSIFNRPKYVLPIPPSAVERRTEDAPLTGSSATRLCQFGEFFAANRSALSAMPSEAICLALNHSTSGPVAKQASRLLNQNPKLHFERIPRSDAILFPACRAIHETKTPPGCAIVANADLTLALIAASEQNGTHKANLQLWNLVNGTCLNVLEGHTDDVVALAASADFKFALSASKDNTLRLWSLVDGSCRSVLRGHTSGVTAVAASADFSRALSAGFDDTLRVWDLASGSCSSVLVERGASSVAVSPDCGQALSFSFDEHVLKIWEFPKGIAKRSIQSDAHGSIGGIAVSADFTQALVTHAESVWLYDLMGGEIKTQLKGHKKKVSAIVVSADFTRALTASWDKTLRLWDLANGACLAVFEGHTSWVTAVAATADFSQAISTSSDGTLRLWDPTSTRCASKLDCHSEAVEAIVVTEDLTQAISWGRDHSLRQWDMESGSCLAVHDWSHVFGAVFVLNSRLTEVLCAGLGQESELRHWDLLSGQGLQVLKGHTDNILALVASEDFQMALSASNDTTLRLWDLAAGRCQTVLVGHTGRVTAVAASADFACAISASGDRTLRIWDLVEGLCRAVLSHSLAGLALFEVNALALSPDLLRALSGGNSLLLWDLTSNRCIKELKGHAEPVTAMIVSADFCLAITGSKDRTLRLWDLSSGQCLALYYTASPVRALAGDFTSGRIVCGTEDGQVHFLTMRNFPPLE